MKDNEDSYASDEEEILVQAEDAESDIDFSSDEDEEEEDPIDSLYTSRSGIKWDELPNKAARKRKARNILKHKGGPKVTVKTEVSHSSVSLLLLPLLILKAG